MKIGIMSMQRIKNYGSYLQAYGLKRLLEDMGAEVEFVDYKTEAPVMEQGRFKALSFCLKKLYLIVIFRKFQWQGKNPQRTMTRIFIVSVEYLDALFFILVKP